MAVSIQSVFIILAWGSAIKLLKGEPQRTASVQGTVCLIRVQIRFDQCPGVIWPTSCIYGTKSGVGEAAGAALQTGLPPGGPVPGNKQQINGSAGIAMS